MVKIKQMAVIIYKEWIRNEGQQVAVDKINK